MTNEVLHTVFLKEFSGYSGKVNVTSSLHKTPALLPEVLQALHLSY